MKKNKEKKKKKKLRSIVQQNIGNVSPPPPKNNFVTPEFLIEDVWYVPKIILIMYSFVLCSALPAIGLGYIIAENLLINHTKVYLFFSTLSCSMFMALYFQLREALREYDIKSKNYNTYEQYVAALKIKYDRVCKSYPYPLMYFFAFIAGILISPLFALFMDGNESVLYNIFIFESKAFLLLMALAFFISFLGRFIKIGMILMVASLLVTITLVIIFLFNIFMPNYIINIMLIFVLFSFVFFYFIEMWERKVPVRLMAFRLYLLFLIVFVQILKTLFVSTLKKLLGEK